METIQEDVNHILAQSKLEKALQTFPFPWRNQKQDPDQVETQTRKYLDTLSSAERMKLKEIYLPDFLMFGYNEYN